MKKLYALLFVLCMYAPVRAQHIDPSSTVPSSGTSFLPDLQNFLKNEDAIRYTEHGFASMVVTGGTHATGAGLAKTPAAMVAYPGGYRITEAGSITYPANSTCYVLANNATTGNTSTYVRVTGTHYLIDCTSVSEPALPSNSVRLMTVVTDGTSVTTVTDRRTTSISGTGGGATSDAKYIIETVDALLPNAFALGSLATGILKNTTTTGVPSIAAAGTDYVAPTGSGAGLTALNASSIASGTVPTARLGSGVADATTYLRGDSTWQVVPGAATGAPTDVTYITQTPNGTLSNEQAMSLLATGIVMNQTGTGVQSIATPGTDYVAPTGSGAGLTALNASAIASGTAPAARLGSGTPDTTTYLRGDNSWQAITTVPALAANGVNCGAGLAAAGVDAAGAVEGCFDVATQVEMNTHSALTGTSAHGATTTNTASQLVARDGSGNFAAGTITAALTGNVTGNVSGNAATATTSSALAAAGWIPPLVTVATLPGAPVDGQEVTVTDALATTDCEVGGGAYRNRCVWNAGGGSWDLALSGVSGATTPTLETVMTAGNTTTKCTEADPCEFGNGTVSIKVYVTDANQMVIEPSVAADRYFTCMTDQVCGFYDTEGAAAILTIDPDAATQIGKYTFGTAYKPTKTVDFPASALTTDTAQCASPALATINSGAPRYTIICADNDASSIYGEVVMPKSWDGGTVTFAHRYVQTAADTGVLNGDIAASCRLATATINNTWGTEIAVDDAAVTGSNAIDITTSAAVTPNGTCTAGTSRLLQFRYQLDAGGTTTAVATLHHLGFTMEYSVTSLSD